MLKTKPSVALFCVIAAFAAVACEQDPTSIPSDGAQSMRPIGPILALRMTPYRAERLHVKGGETVRRVPESHVKWRVESVILDVVGPAANQLEIDIDQQSARITGTVPTSWQAKAITDQLSSIDVLRNASIEWQIIDPTAKRPPTRPAQETTPDIDGDSGPTPPNP
jgi:hypothetical protein